MENVGRQITTNDAAETKIIDSTAPEELAAQEPNPGPAGAEGATKSKGGK